MNNDIKDTGTPYRFMLPLVLSTMMNPLNSTMLATALLSLCNSFKVTVGQGAILITCLYVTATVAQPLMGRLADTFSAKKINTVGFVLVLIAACIGAFAPAFGWLIVSRILLGLGTSAAYPSAIALINRKYAEVNQPVPGQVLGLVAISSQVSMVLGPVLGGLLTQWLGWKGIFLINIPWVLTGLYLSRALPDFPTASTREQMGLFKKLDVIGILLFSSFLLSLMTALIQKPFSWWLLLPSAALLGGLIGWERKQPAPFIDVKLLHDKPALLLTYLRTLATNYILYQMMYALPPWIESVKHISPGHTGLMVLPESAMAIIMGLLVSKSSRLFQQNLLGVITMLIACLSWLVLNQQSGVVLIIGVALIIGIADGINMIANQALLNQEAPLAQKGISFGLFRTSGYIGAIISSTHLKTLFHHGVTDHNFHQMGILMLFASGVLVLLLIPLWQRKQVLDAPKSA
ncbi:MFS transporter [Mucilaginibacter robiniae]|uniref:MFS transporter n=1 Tax=Mucilaginibacter robiniae TaxID=2728022 RepID=A0A7L5E9D2_9SPHI|nr:MFS transporter [Mucilaginibacter robiniae]QJD96996.1 MFS transporter [Mucilaginibacter robiniae]